MVAEVSADVEALIEQMDPKRDYGELSYEQVVEAVRAGTIRIFEGIREPMLRDAETNMAVKGSGVSRAVLSQVDPNRLTKQKFLERAHADFDDVYDALIREAKKGGVRAIGIYMEYTFGRPIARPAAEMPDVVGKFLEAMERQRGELAEEKRTIDA